MAASNITSQVTALLSRVEADGETAGRVEVLYLLERMTEGLREHGIRTRLSRVCEAEVPEELSAAISRALSRALRIDFEAAPASPDAEIKAELAGQILLSGDAASRRQFLEASLENRAYETIGTLAEHFERESDPEIRSVAALAIGVLGGPEILPVLKSASRDPEPDVRVAAIDALTYQQGSQVQRYILERLTDSSRTVRRAARVALRRLPMTAIVRLLRSLPENKGTKLRRAVVTHLKFYPEHKDARKLLREMMQSSSEIVAAEALMGLADLGDETALGKILDLDGHCGEKMQRVVEMAKEAYANSSEQESATLRESQAELTATVQRAGAGGGVVPPESDEDGDSDVLRAPASLDDLLSLPASTVDSSLSESSAETDLSNEELFDSMSSDVDSDEFDASVQRDLEELLRSAPPPPETAPEEPLELDEGLPPTPSVPPPPPDDINTTVVAEAPREEPPEETRSDIMSPPLGIENPWDSISGAPGVEFHEPAPSVAAADPELEAGQQPEEGAAEPAELTDLPKIEDPHTDPNDIPPPPAEFQELEQQETVPRQTTLPASGSAGPDSSSLVMWRWMVRLVVVAVLGGTSWLAYQATVADQSIDSKRAKLETDLNLLARAVLTYQDRTGSSFNAESLESLFEKDPKALPVDPWQRTYRYDPIFRRVFSMGPDGFPDRGTKLGNHGIVPDDVARFLETPPEPLGASFLSRGQFTVAVWIPGDQQVEEFGFSEEEAAPVRPVFTSSMSKVAYLIQDPESGEFRAYWRRKDPTLRLAWQPAEALLPKGWQCSQLAWVRAGAAVLFVGGPPGSEDKIYGVVPGTAPVLLAPGVAEAQNLAVASDGRRLLFTARRAGKPRSVALGILPSGEGFRPGGLKVSWGPKGHHPLFGHLKGTVLYVDELDNKQWGLLRWSPGDTSDEKHIERLFQSDLRLSSPVLAPSGRYLAFCQQKSVKVLRLDTLRATDVFEADTPPVQLIWPIPSRLIIP